METPPPPPPPVTEEEAEDYWQDETPLGEGDVEADESEQIKRFTTPAAGQASTPVATRVNTTLAQLGGMEAEAEEQTPRRPTGHKTRRAMSFVTPGGVEAEKERPARRKLYELEEEEEEALEPETPILIKPRTPVPRGLFEVYVDVPMQTGLPVPVIVVRQVGNLLRDGRAFVMECFNLRTDGHPTVSTRGTHPVVTQVPEGSGRYCVHFTASSILRSEDPNAERTPLGIVRLRRNDFPASYLNRRQGTELLHVDPVFLAVPNQHVTVVMSSRQYSTAPHHFVLQLLDGNGRSLVTLALAKPVFAALLFQDQKEITFHPIPVASGVNVQLKLRVRRMRRRLAAGAKDKFVHVAIDEVRWYVPQGIDTLP